MANFEIDKISLKLRMLEDTFRAITFATDCEHSVLDTEALNSILCTNCDYMELLIDQLDAANK